MTMTHAITRLNQALAVAALAAALTGCEERKTVDGQFGELGRLTFSYSRSCFFGCIVDQPLLSGTREKIKLAGEGAAQPKLKVSAVDEDVLEVALDRQCYCEREDTTGRLDVATDAICKEPWHLVCENTILVAAGEPGDTKLQVYNERNELIDRVILHVKEARRARFFGTLPDKLGEEADDRFALPAESRLELRLELYDEHGVELLAPEGVTWRVSDPTVATLNAFLIGAGEEVSAGRDITVETHAAGEATVEIDVPGLQASIDVEVE